MKSLNSSILSKNVWSGLIVLIIICMLSMVWSNVFKSNIHKDEELRKLVGEWYDLFLEAEIETDGFRFPVAARSYALIGLAGYHTFIHKEDGNYLPLTNIYPEFEPKIEDHHEIEIIIALNACYAQVGRLIFQNSKAHIKSSIVNLEKKWNSRFQLKYKEGSFDYSARLGQSVANMTWEYSKIDHLGHFGQYFNYDLNYNTPPEAGKWQTSSEFPMPAMLPYWGKVNTMIVSKDSIELIPPAPFDTTDNSIYFKQSLEIVTLNSTLTNENREIAEFWSDDHHGLVFGHPGHWISIAKQVIEMKKPESGMIMETYMKMGISLFDASVICWKAKYHFNNLRPEQFIRKYIDPLWIPLEPAPPHPSYPSGHSVYGAAAVEVLIDIFGDSIAIIDRSHENRKNFKINPRSFRSFTDMAQENALSRILIGAHFRMDCEEGLRIGRLVGKEINKINIHNSNQIPESLYSLKMSIK